MNESEKTPPAVSREQASAAGLLAAILFFFLAVAGFVVVNRYWPAVRTVVPMPSTELDGAKTAK
jgi:hypothetical protein